MATPLKHILFILLAVFLVSSFTPIGTTDNDLMLRGKPISFYLAHPQISQVCKDIYTGKRAPSADKDILALMDSMFTLNDETKAFYFLTVTQTMHKADGAYAEALGLMAKSFVETRTREFLNYTINEPLVTAKYYNEWVKTVVGEIKICAEGHEKEEVGFIKTKMLKSCTECTKQQKDKLNDFIARVEKKCR